uniref:Mitochondrial import inner membrane translocase subunit Tim21 n=1 Tax=Plectus sambesii TaxID=2011161 RepID=A0A914WBN9_9BILA
MVQLSTLVKVAGGTLVAGTCGMYFAHRVQQARVKAFPHYTEALKICKAHDKVTAALGEPIKLGDVDLKDYKRNYLGVAKSRLRVPMVGSRESGFLNIFALKAEGQPAVGYRVALLQLELTSEGDVITIYDTRQWTEEIDA